MAISKVIYKSNVQDTGTVWVDMTSDTAAADKILTPYTAHIANGTQATGTALGSSYTLIHQEDIVVNTTSTTATEIAWIGLSRSAWTDDAFLYVKIRDKAGPRNGYFVGSDNFLANTSAANGTTTDLSNTAFTRWIFRKSSGGSFATSTSTYGVYASYFTLGPDGTASTYSQLNISRRYNSTYSLTINGTYNIQVYLISYASTQGSPFDFSFS